MEEDQSSVMRRFTADHSRRSTRGPLVGGTVEVQVAENLGAGRRREQTGRFHILTGLSIAKRSVDVSNASTLSAEGQIAFRARSEDLLKEINDDNLGKMRRAGLGRPALQISIGRGVMSDLKVRPPNRVLTSIELRRPPQNSGEGCVGGACWGLRSRGCRED